MWTPNDKPTVTAPAPILAKGHPLERVSYPNGEFMPRMWDKALLVMEDDAAGAAKALKAVAFSHGYRSTWVRQEVPTDLLYISPDVVLLRVAPPTDEQVEGTLCGRTMEDGWIYNWYVAQVNPAAAVPVAYPVAASAGVDLALLRVKLEKMEGALGPIFALSYGDPFTGKPVDPGWTIMCGDWRDELVFIHGPQGHITSGLTMEQATALVNAHGAAFPGVAAAEGAE